MKKIETENKNFNDSKHSDGLKLQKNIDASVTMMLLMRLAFLLYGLRLKSSDDGGSVPRARAPIVSMMRFTQSIITISRVRGIEKRRENE